MAQRNPMNQRYVGDGPQGQSRKSATSAKPVTEAASSVRLKGKPATSAEKKAAEKERQAKIQQKTAERQRKAARVRQQQRTAEAKARLARGEITPEEMDEEIIVEEEEPKKKGRIAEEASRETILRQNPEYVKWRRIYWIVMGAGMVLVVLTLVIQGTLPDVFIIPGRVPLWVVAMVPAYVMVVAVIIIQLVKLRPIIRDQDIKSGKPSPKQLKHEAAAKAQAEQMEAARKAAKKSSRSKGKDTT